MIAISLKTLLPLDLSNGLFKNKAKQVLAS